MRKKHGAPVDGAVIEFCRQMAMFLRAGFSLSEALSLLAEDGGEARRLSRLWGRVEELGALAPALEETGDYPPFFVRMVHLGEETGRLDSVLEALADHYQRELSLRASVRSAIAYPAMMVSMLVVILLVLLTQVMPVFDQVFAQLGTRLTGVSRLLMDWGEALRSSGSVLLVVAVVLAAAALWLRSHPAPLRRLLRKLPWLRRVWDGFSLSRIMSALALGLASGLSTHYALELASGLCEDEVFAPKMAKARDILTEGGDLVEALRDSEILTGSGSRLALVGERTGTLDEAFSRIAAETREEADRRISAAIALIEPTLVVILSLLVGGLLFSVLLPMLGILSAL